MQHYSMATKIALNKFKPRDYQIPLFQAIENKGLKRALCVWPRRAGKDLAAFNLILRQALKQCGVYYYIFPTFSQARRVIWDSITNDGTRFLDFIPKELILKTNQQQMKIELVNGSLIQLVGSDNYDALMGTNPRGCIFSEYALQDPRAYQFIRPILTANQGWAAFISTPRGKNHLWDLFQIASNSPKYWYCSKLSVLDTGHIDIEEIRKEIASGEMSEDMANQEYYTSFDLGVEGAYYAKYLDKMRLNDQIRWVPHEIGHVVHTAWDLGVRDATSIIFFQVIGQTVRIIDYYENSKVGLEHYAQILQEKPYKYGKHIAPHDIAVQELGTGISRLEKARHLGIKFTIAPKLAIIDGIEAVRTLLPKTYIDKEKCAHLVKALENYRQEFDAKRKVYVPRPLHDVWSHAADAMRYLAVSLPKTRDGMSAQELDKQYQQAMYGQNLPFPFN